MIQTNPNPRMTTAEVKQFRRRLEKCVSKDFTPEERKAIQERQERMANTAHRIISNNGGKNPILGY